MQTKVPEITDHTESNLFVKIISIWAALVELLHYYIDNAARELFLSTTRQYESAVKIAKLFDYRLKGVIAATGSLKFYTANNVTADVLIPIGSIVTTEDGIEFTTTSQGSILAGTKEITVPVRQEIKVLEDEIGVSNGTPNQRFVLESGVRDMSMTVKVGIELYQFVSSFAFSTATDKVYSASLNRNKEMEIVFGDGTNGLIPLSGASIKAAYGLSVGNDGNLAENTITALKVSITGADGQSVEVTNVDRTSGGHNVETLADLQKLVPLSIRTLNRAVTFQDYIDIAELQSGVASAGVVFKCGKTVDVYIVPEGGGIASQQLLDYVKDAYYDETRMVTTAVRVLPAGEVRLSFLIKIKVKSAFNRNEVEGYVRANVAKYVNETNEQIGGTLEIGNIYEIVEGTTGVDFCNVELVKPLPYARINNGIAALNWIRVMKPTSLDLVRWSLKYTATGEFILQRNGVYAGTVYIGVPVVLPELNFTLNGAYTVNDAWEFYTYPYNQSLILNEPSVFRLYPTDLTLDITGGI